MKRICGFAALLLVLAVSAMLLPPAGRLVVRADEPTITTGERYILRIEACKAAAKVLLKGLESNRNALEKPERWSSVRGYRPPKIKSWRDLKFDDPLVPYDEMTYEERLLVWGFPAHRGSSINMMPMHLAMIAYGQYSFSHRLTPDLLFMRSAPMHDIAHLEDDLAMLISPVTGKLIEVDHKEFSVGNAYVRVVTEEDVKELVKLDPSVDEWWNYACWSLGTKGGVEARRREQHYTTLTGKEMTAAPAEGIAGTHPSYVVYVRIYGLNGVLSEGLY